MHILRNATHWRTGEVLDCSMENGRIIALGKETSVADEEIDVQGLILFPGFIDPHVHLREPGGSKKETWKTGTRAAARGGFTTIFDMPNTTPPLTDGRRLEEKRALAKDALVNYGFHFALTADNSEELERLRVRSIKLFLGRSTGNLLVDDVLLQKAFTRLPNALFVIHGEAEECLQRFAAPYAGEENPAIHSVIRNRSCAVEAMERVLELVRAHHRPVYFCHISTKEEVALIRQAKEEGLPVYAEVTPHHLFLDEGAYATLGTRAKVNPPLHTAMDRAALCDAVNDGTIDVIGTDHAPHLLAEKDLPYAEAPAGLPGLETAAALLLHAMHKGAISQETIGRAMSTRPAEIFGLSTKGRLAQGMDADLTLIDPNLTQRVLEKDLETKCRWSPWQGVTLTGWPVMTVVNGTVVYNHGIFHPSQGKEIRYA